MSLSASQLLLSGLPKTIQCNKTKTGTYKKSVDKYIAIDNYNFIQIQHDKYHKFIVIDIDNRDNFKDFYDIICHAHFNKIPMPTYIVETTKGFHVWWAFNKPLWKNNKLHIQFKKQLTDKLNNIFGGDKHSAGFIVRNPLTHEHFYQYSEYDYKDFKYIVDIEKVTIDNVKPKYINKYEPFDIKNVVKGERNKYLRKYLYHFGFTNYEALSLKSFIEEAKKYNSKLQEPQPDSEVEAVAKSTWKFITKHYNPNFSNGKATERNRKLAKKKAKKAQDNIVKNIGKLVAECRVSFNHLFFDLISKNWLAKQAKVSVPTLRKYYKLIKKILLEFVKKTGEYKKLNLIIMENAIENFDAQFLKVGDNVKYDKVFAPT